MANLFKKASKLNAPPKVTAKPQREEFHVAGLKQYAELDALARSSSEIMKLIGAEVKCKALDIFINNANGKKPEPFRGVDGVASAVIECRKRGQNDSLNETEVELLATYGIDVKKQVIVPQLFGINPKYINDEALLEKISAALDTIDVPPDVIVVQDEVSKYVVDDEAIEKAFKMNAPIDVIETITTLVINKPKLETTDLVQIMDDLKSIVSNVNEAD